MQNISIKGILDDLSNGLTRTVSSQGYDESIGSIETKYGLSKADVSLMFKHPLLMNKKTKKAPSFNLIDDVSEETITTQAAPAYGARPASANSPSESEPGMVIPGVTANEEPQLTAEDQTQTGEVEAPLETATPESQF